MPEVRYLFPFISILIPTKDNEEDLIDCLTSIKNLDYPHDKIEIIIWDNNSEEESKQELKAFLANNLNQDEIQITLIEYSRNLGGFTTRDELLKRISRKTQFALSIDDDVILPPQLLNRLIPLLNDDSSIGIVGPRTVFADDPCETAHGAGLVNWWLGRYSDEDATQVIECDYVIGCCMLIKREVIDTLGGFDRDYYTSHGEVDFCLKAKRKGYKIVYYPDVIVRHRVAKEGTQSMERRYYLYRNKLFIIKKNAPIPQKWISLCLYSIFWYPKAIIDSFRRTKRIDLEDIKVISRAMADGWLNRTGPKK